eukprot:scaffold10671_cov107-Skeletonema_marinoi.AAC.2
MGRRRRKNGNSQNAYGAVVDNRIKVETTRSLATEFSDPIAGWLLQSSAIPSDAAVNSRC